MTLRTISLLGCFAFLFLITACGADREQPEETLIAVPPAPESTVFDAASTALQNNAEAAKVSDLLLANYSKVSNERGELNDAAISQYLTIVNQLVRKYPADTNAAPALYKAADLLRAKGADAEVAKIYAGLRSNYPTYSKAGEALFMEAFTYDENLKDYDRARVLYEEFIQAYPDHTFADDAAIMLENLGKSGEEIIQGLE